MRVMTFNLRFENDQDGANAWVHRREPVTRLIRQYAPSILGTQEGKWSQLLYLQNHLPEYHLHAPGRVLDDTCQYPTLYVRRDTFDVRGGEEFWLSRTPEVHRSKDWDSAFPRMVSCARLRDGKTGGSLWVAVTHLDHMGSEARYEQARILAQWVKTRNGPVILMGDFNDAPGSPVHRVLAVRGRGLRDTWQILGRKEGPESFTHHAFTGIPKKARIDWILVSPHFRVKAATVIRDRFESRYPSDHFPYSADLQTAGNR